MSERPELLGTLVPSGDDEAEVDPAEIIEMSLDFEMISMLHREGLTFDDVLAGRVPGIDPQEILARAEEECADDGTMWWSCTR